MISELDPRDYRELAPLYHAANACFPLILSVLENKQSGQVFWARHGDLRAALVLHKFGFMSVFEDAPKVDFDDEMGQLFQTAGVLRPSYLLWYNPPERWQRRLASLPPQIVRNRERIRFIFDDARASELHEAVKAPAGFELSALTADLLPATRKLGVDIESRFWSSADDFADNGFGVCLLRDGQVVSLCYAAAVAGGLAEVDVTTDPEFRQRGLAALVTRGFINECRDRGVVPTWDCFEYNSGSIKLAEKLGFVESIRYPFFSFNVPLRLDEARCPGRTGKQ